ncbi:MAG: hypothetical protein N3D75_02660 [Candidatus Aenigmarchaeota archaeon]|nr:hypothetical protein [Candidatus Aenigmarchaeota archaeon]
MKKFLIAIFIALSNVNALGVLDNNNYISIEPGGSEIYSILIWDKENTRIRVETVEKPDFFYVIIKQNDFYLNSSSENYVFVENDYLPTTRLDILIRADEKAAPGNYLLKFKLTSESESKGLSVFQERIFSAKVSVSGSNEIITRPTQTEKNDSIKLDENVAKVLIILIAVIIAAIVVLK